MNLEKVISASSCCSRQRSTSGFSLATSTIRRCTTFTSCSALAVSLIATVLKFGDRTQIGAVHLATSLVADLQLVAAVVVWIWTQEISAQGMTAAHTASMVSLSGGALLANLVSVVLLLTETVTFHRG